MSLFSSRYGSLRRIGWLLVTMLLSACSGGGSSGPTGSLTLGVTDAPVDSAEQVVVEFTGLHIKPESGNAFLVIYDAPKSLDLLALTGGTTELLLDGKMVPAGNYEWIRLLVNADANVRDSYILVSGSEYELRIPSGSQTGLKLNRGFSVPEGGSAAFTIDFDLRKSVHAPNGGSSDYILRPTLRLVDNSIVGTLSGAASACPSSQDKAAVYVFDGSVVSADDVDGDDGDPITTAMVPQDGSYNYTVPFLEAGSYVAAFTCNAAEDDPEIDDAGITFSGQTEVVIVAGQTALQNF